MTKDDIIKLAQEAASVYATETWTFNLAVNQLAHFAHLVAKHEREACAKLCEAQGEYGWQQYADAIRARGELK